MITKIKRTVKRMVCLLGVSALFAANMQVKAAEISEPTLEVGPIVQSVNAGYLHNNLSITNNGSANISANAVGKQGTTKTKVTVKLQKYDSSKKQWNTLKTWENEKKSITVSVEKTYKLSAKGTYRCKCTVVFTKSGKKETLTETTGKKQYK